MIRNRLISASVFIAGLVAAHAAFASPVVIINQGQSTACTITPSSGTVFTLSTTGDVLINGSYTSGTCSSGASGGTGNPTFSFNPNPADLSVLPSTLGSGGGTVTPSFVAYFANSCTGTVTAGSGCAPVTGAWGTGGAVCTGTTNAMGQTYCSPNGATVSIPNNTAATSCSYSFKAVNCTNGTTSVNSQIANVTVNGFVTGSCTDGDHTGDLGALGYSRQCSGSVHSFNLSLHPTWTTNGFSDIMSAGWPGAAGQLGQGLSITVNANGFGSWKFNTGSTVAGLHFESNSSYGVTGLMSISTTPGDFFPGSTALCFGSTLNISTKSPTTATCKLSLNTDYYLNVSNADFFTPHATDCTTSACTTGWTPYGYGN
jgi:hypothetical protein